MRTVSDSAVSTSVACVGTIFEAVSAASIAFSSSRSLSDDIAAAISYIVLGVGLLRCVA